MSAVGEAWSGRQLVVPQRIRLRRRDLGLTQQQVVTRLERIGVQTTNRTVSSLEHGTGVDVAKLPELAVALDCTVTYLLGLTDAPNRWDPDSWPVSAAPHGARRPVAHHGLAGPAGQSAGPAQPAGIGREAPGSGRCLILGADIPDRRIGVLADSGSR